MTHKLAILAVLCLASSNGLELENLCEKDLFSYKNVLVNSFHRRIEHAVLLPPPFYMIDIYDNCEDDRFDDTATRDKALEIKNEYNERIARLYSDESHNSNEWNVYTLAAEYADFERFIRRLNKLNKPNSNEQSDLLENCLSRFKVTIRRGQDLTLSFAPFYRHQFQTSEGEHIRPTRQQQTELLHRRLSYLTENVNENQTLLFAGDGLAEIYQKQIVWPVKFYLVPGKEKTDPENALDILYEIVFPFHHENYNPLKPCEPAEKLPGFFPRTPELSL